MKNKNYVIIGLAVIVIGFFMYRSATYMAANKKDYPSTSGNYTNSIEESDTTIELGGKGKVEGFPLSIKIDEFANNLPDNYRENPLVYQKFQSSNYDSYRGMELLSNIKKETYHLFDFANSVVTMNAPLNSGQFQKFEFRIEIVDRDVKGLVECNVLNHPNLEKIFISAVSGAITYEFNDNYSLEFYDIQKISKN